MQFAGIQCSVYGKVETTIDMALKGQKRSSGKMQWYDFTKQYDNTEIKFIVTSDDIVALERVVREQNTTGEIAVTFENDEWLYDYSGTFCILKATDFVRTDRGYSEYGYSVTIAPTTTIDYRTIAGSRSQCYSVGALKYGGVDIPQPKEYKYKYNTHKYSGVTHGSSYSAEMQTIRYDETKFSVDIESSVLRSLVDSVVLNRGNAFMVEFPAYNYPFGVARGELAQSIPCIISDTDITFTTNGNGWYNVELGVLANEIEVS